MVVQWNYPVIHKRRHFFCNLPHFVGGLKSIGVGLGISGNQLRNTSKSLRHGLNTIHNTVLFIDVNQLEPPMQQQLNQMNPNQMNPNPMPTMTPNVSGRELCLLEIHLPIWFWSLDYMNHSDLTALQALSQLTPSAISALTQLAASGFSGLNSLSGSWSENVPSSKELCSIQFI